MTLFKVIDLIKILALKHPNVNSAEEGDIYNLLNANKEHKYAKIVLTQDTHTEDEVFDNYNLNIFYVDRLFSDIETNRLDIQSTAKNVLSNIIRAFCEEFDAECNSINYHTFTERFADECAGAYAAITISIPKDSYCTEKYWDGNWSAPAIKIVNQDKKVEFTSNGVYVIDYDSTLYTGLGKVEVEVNVETDGSYEEGYNEGYLDGETDGYSDGLADGIADGIEQQKSKLESITITENGVYEKEDGYDEITVNVIDTNGSYEDGYLDGKNDGIENAGEIIAENAQVLNITESGIYTTKYTKDEDVQVTGYFDDGTPFYNYLLLFGKSLKTDVTLNSNSNIELWWKPDFNIAHEYTEKRIISLDKDTWLGDIILGYNTPASTSDSEKIFLRFDGLVYTYNKKITDKWYHIVISFDDGFFVDGEKVGDLNLNWDITQDYVYINHSILINSTNNGYYGMVKVDGNIYLPTVNGYINYNTNTPLESVYNGSFVYYEGLKGTFNNLIRTVNVDVAPKINVEKTGIKLSYSSFNKVPECFDFEGVNHMAYMFYNCSKLTTIPLIDTSNVTSMAYMFYNCQYFQTIPLINTENVTEMQYMFYGCGSLKTIPQLDTSKVRDMSNMFYKCSNLTTIPQLDTSKVQNISYMFNSCTNLTSLPSFDVSNVSTEINGFFGTSTFEKLTDFGGLVGYKGSRIGNFKNLPNLTYQSCINVLNGLYDFTGNNETPSSSQGKLKVHANFLTTVGDEINIASEKGWVIQV